MLDDEAAAVALLNTFKTASVSMFSNLDFSGITQMQANSAFALSFTEVANSAPDAASDADAGADPDASPES